MMSSLVRRALLAAFIAAVSISGCKCGSKVQGAGCQSDEECRADFNGSDRAFCDQSKSPSVCALHPKQCDTAADCCPAQVCNAQGHYCFDKYTPCTQDGSCPAQGEVCKEIGVFAKGLGCTYNKCDPTGACGEGTNCFNKFCVGEPQHIFLFLALRIGNNDKSSIAAGVGDQSEPDAGIAGSTLDDKATRPDIAAFFRL